MCTSGSGVESKVAMDENENENPVEKSERPPNPWETSSFLSKLFFLWPYPLLKLGMERPLEDKDLYNITSEDSSVYQRDYLARLWKNEKDRTPKGQRPNLHRVILKDYFKSVWFIQPMEFVGQSAWVLQAVLLGQLVEFLQGRNDKGFLWASLLVVCALL